MLVEERITKKLQQAFAPETLEVVNDSHRHVIEERLRRLVEEHHPLAQAHLTKRS